MTVSALIVGNESAKPSVCLEAKPAGNAGDIVVPEETIFGIVSRYHVLSGHPTSGNTLIELLNRRSVALGTAFPSDLHLISDHLGLPVNSIELIEGHTILPCFQPFMKGARYSRIVNSIAMGVAKNTKITLGLLTSRVGAEDVLRFCPVCAEVDCETIGIATWYRAHQFPGVLVCPYHGVPLVAFDCLVQRLKRTQLFLPASVAKWTSQKNVLKVDERVNEKLVLISRLITQLILLQSGRVDPLASQNHYLAHLVNRGLATTGLSVRQQALRSELLCFWKSIRDLHPFDHIFARCDGDHSWLTGLYRRPHFTHHPLLHALLIGFLAENIESFLLEGILPPAITPVSHERESEVAECKIAALVAKGWSMRQVAKELGLSVNTVLFKAEKIGIDFTRRPRKLSVEVRSWVKHALAEGGAIANIAKTTGLSTGTISRILGADRGLQTQRAASMWEKRRKHARDKLKAVVLASPSAGFKTLKAALGADFTWLYRHDHTWLRDQLPATRPIVERTSSVDWGIRDREMAERVRLAVVEILEPSRRPIRVTLNEIGRRTGNASWLDKHLARLPRTAELLSLVLEPAARYRARRLAWNEKCTDLEGLFVGDSSRPKPNLIQSSAIPQQEQTSCCHIF